MSENETKPASKFEAAAIDGTAFTNGICRALNCEDAGHINFTDAEGTLVESFPVQAGYNPIKADKVDAPTSGTAPTSVWGLFE